MAYVTVKAFLVNHGDVPQALGYRIETSDRTIVISGDPAPSQSAIDSCTGCDVLIHEAYSMMTSTPCRPPIRNTAGNTTPHHVRWRRSRRKRVPVCSFCITVRTAAEWADQILSTCCSKSCVNSMAESGHRP